MLQELRAPVETKEYPIYGDYRLPGFIHSPMATVAMPGSWRMS